MDQINLRYFSKKTEAQSPKTLVTVTIDLPSLLLRGSKTKQRGNRLLPVAAGNGIKCESNYGYPFQSPNETPPHWVLVFPSQPVPPPAKALGTIFFLLHLCFCCCFIPISSWYFILSGFLLLLGIFREYFPSSFVDVWQIKRKDQNGQDGFFSFLELSLSALELGRFSEGKTRSTISFPFLLLLFLLLSKNYALVFSYSISIIVHCPFIQVLCLGFPQSFLGFLIFQVKVNLTFTVVPVNLNCCRSRSNIIFLF